MMDLLVFLLSDSAARHYYMSGVYVIESRTECQPHVDGEKKVEKYFDSLEMPLYVSGANVERNNE